jgi:hypothetical protein
LSKTIKAEKQLDKFGSLKRINSHLYYRKPPFSFILKMGVLFFIVRKRTKRVNK